MFNKLLKKKFNSFLHTPTINCQKWASFSVARVALPLKPQRCPIIRTHPYIGAMTGSISKRSSVQHHTSSMVFSTILSITVDDRYRFSLMEFLRDICFQFLGVLLLPVIDDGHMEMHSAVKDYSVDCHVALNRRCPIEV